MPQVFKKLNDGPKGLITDSSTSVYIHSLCIPSAITTEIITATATGSTNKNEQLLYMPSLVGGEGLQLLIDSGAMHNFALNALLENLHLPVIVVK